MKRTKTHEFYFFFRLIDRRTHGAYSYTIKIILLKKFYKLYVSKLRNKRYVETNKDLRILFFEVMLYCKVKCI